MTSLFLKALGNQKVHDELVQRVNAHFDKQSPNRYGFKVPTTEMYTILCCDLELMITYQREDTQGFHTTVISVREGKITGTGFQYREDHYRKAILECMENDKRNRPASHN